MKRLWWFVGAISILLYVASASSQEDNLMMNSTLLGKHQRPIVNFPHSLHESLIECNRCHHDMDEFGANMGEDGQKCSDCHLQKANDNPIPLVRAFHLQCKGCHEKITKKGKYAPPLICGNCHIR